MEENKKSDHSLLAIDACRPGHDDLQLPDLLGFAQQLKSQPELAVRFARVQRCDAQIQAAMQNVEVPSGARQRLLQRLNADVRPAEISVPVPKEVPVLPEPTQARSLWWPLALAASLLLGTSLLFVLSWNSAASPDVHATAVAFFDQRDGAWKDLLQEKPSIPLPPRLALRPHSWKHVSAGSLTGVAYDVSLRHCRGILFVCAMPKSLQLPTSPPAAPETFHDGWSLAVWQSGDQLCMLVVEGDDRAYRDLIRAASGPIASAKRCRFRSFG
jgi:hypothetical protein